jgi:predicted transcriptional regulator|tara:strand:+ start:757 stop:1026 length:270 start_codon:yes stop_codon:yes gene_type:complete
MIRTTSIMAYNELKGSGKQPKQKDIILNVLRDSINPMSLQEICNKTGFAINAVSGRVNDLKKANQVVEAEKRKCSVTCKTITPVTALRF